jgi:23S rRNA (uracil1939-C5)-methyltransferase
MARKRRRRLPEGEFSVTIGELSHTGNGVAKVDNKAVFVAGGLPGEEVKIKYTKTNRNYDNAKAVEILKPSPDRVAPQCPHFMTCGGCVLQHLDHNKQIIHKEKILLNELKHNAKSTPKSIIPPVVGQPFGYRHKARLGVRVVPQKGGALVGFRELNSNFLAVMDSCEVLHPQVGRKINALQSLIDNLEIGNQIAQIEVSVGENACILVFRNLAQLPETDIETLDKFGLEHGFHIHTQSGGPDTVEPLLPAHKTELSYSLDDLEFRFSPNNFTQVNFAINRKMVSQAIDNLDLSPDDKVLDLFCGLGNFTLAISQHAKEALGVEAVQSLVDDAYRNARLNSIGNVEFKVFDLQGDDMSAPWLDEPWDKVLLDPPRSGAKEILPLIAKIKPKLIVYVSCNPATLARDTAILVHDYGYVLDKAGVLDMFPHTAHVESMAVFMVAE